MHPQLAILQTELDRTIPAVESIFTRCRVPDTTQPGKYRDRMWGARTVVVTLNLDIFDPNLFNAEELVLLCRRFQALREQERLVLQEIYPPSQDGLARPSGHSLPVHGNVIGF